MQFSSTVPWSIL